MMGARAWLRRLDRIAGELNALLVVFAIGLATLDVTFFVAQQSIDRLSQLAQVADPQSTGDVGTMPPIN